MKRRSILTLPVILTLGFVLQPGAVLGQQKSLKVQIVGSWTLVEATDIHADGTKTNPWGANAKGTYMFSADGRFIQMLLHGDLPRSTAGRRGPPTRTRRSRKASSRYMAATLWTRRARPSP